jgi:hypothetical protein
MIINKFQSLEHLNEVFNKLFDSPYINEITLDTVDTIAANLEPSRKESVISILNLNTNQDIYIYLGSKTDFKKEYYSNIPTSLYEKYYDVLRDNEVIVAATGAYVLVKKTDLSQSILDLINVTIDNTQASKVISSLITQVNDLQKDVKYYAEYVESLEKQAQELLDQNSKAREDLYNKTITTWY